MELHFGIDIQYILQYAEDFWWYILETERFERCVVIGVVPSIVFESNGQSRESWTKKPIARYSRLYEKSVKPMGTLI